MSAVDEAERGDGVELVPVGGLADPVEVVPANIENMMSQNWQATKHVTDHQYWDGSVSNKH